jgi:hypothetical protein
MTIDKDMTMFIKFMTSRSHSTYYLCGSLIYLLFVYFYVSIKIFVQEYCQPLCASLGVQAMISSLTVKVSMVCPCTSQHLLTYSIVHIRIDS